MELNVNRVYDLHEIFNDINRMIILIYLYDKMSSGREISKNTGISLTIVNHHLEYLRDRKVIKKDNNLYNICDKYINKIIMHIKNYVIK